MYYLKSSKGPVLHSPEALFVSPGHLPKDDWGLELTLRLLLLLWAFWGKVGALGAKVWAFSIGVHEP